jgi:hypothetical protein
MILMMDHHENQDDLATAAPSSIMILMISLSYHVPVRDNGHARTHDNDPATYGATASDMGISIGDACRAERGCWGPQRAPGHSLSGRPARAEVHHTQAASSPWRHGGAFYVEHLAAEGRLIACRLMAIPRGVGCPCDALREGRKGPVTFPLGLEPQKTRWACAGAYAHQSRNRQLEIDAAEIRIRAERRLGELLVEQKATVGLNRGLVGRAVSGSTAEPLKDTRPTLSDIGVDKKLSSHAQRVAAIPSAEFEGIVGQWRDTLETENERVTTNILAAAEKAAGRPHVANNSGNNEWYTPGDIIEAARAVLGGFDLDPASSEIANRTVRAARFFTAHSRKQATFSLGQGFD